MSNYAEQLEALLLAVQDAARGGHAPKDAVDALYTFCTERTPDEFALCSSALFPNQRDAGVLRFLKADNTPYNGVENRVSEDGQRLRRELLDFIAKYVCIVEEKIADHLLSLRCAALDVFKSEEGGKLGNAVRIAAMGLLLELMPVASHLRMGNDFGVEEVHSTLQKALTTTGQNNPLALGKATAPGEVVGACVRVLGALAEAFPTQALTIGNGFYVEHGLGSLYHDLVLRLHGTTTGGDRSAAAAGKGKSKPTESFGLVSGVLDGLSSLLRGPMASARHSGLPSDKAAELYRLVVTFLSISQDDSRYAARLSAIRLFAYHMAALFAPFAARDVATCAAAQRSGAGGHGTSTWALVLGACRHKNADVRNHGKAALTALVRAVAGWIREVAPTPAPAGADAARAGEYKCAAACVARRLR